MDFLSIFIFTMGDNNWMYGKQGEDNENQ